MKTLKDLLKDTPVTALHGDGSTTVAALAYDSRAVTRGDCFFATRGTQSDGHDFIPAALRLGAAAAVAHERRDYGPGTVLYVKNTQRALMEIAKAYRAKFSIRCVGVTGSVGKTTTKEMIADVLSCAYRTLKTEGNLNNEIGLPKTLFRLDRTTEAAVVAVAYGLLVSTLIYHQLSLKGLMQIIRRTVITTNICMFIVLSSTVFAAIMTREQIPVIVGNAIMSVASNRLMFYLLVTLLLLFVGTFMETIPAIMILAPILTPMLGAYGINPVSFGVIMVITLGIGMLTPPVGINLYTAVSLCGEKVERVINRHLFAYIGCALVVLALLIGFEGIIMFLPNLLR